MSDDTPDALEESEDRYLEEGELQPCPDCKRTDGYHPYECRYANKDLY